MATCGNCKSTGQTVAHIKACYGTPVAKPATSTANKATTVALQPVPDAQYAIDAVDGSQSVYYSVRHGKKGTQWEKVQFVDRLVGHPGDWQRFPVKGADKRAVLARINAVTPAVAAKRFADEYTCCARCYSPLSDKISIATGLGEKCRSYFGM